MPHKTAAVSAEVLCTLYNHAPCHFTQSHIRKVYASLAVTCHLHFWQNNQDLLHAAAVTRRWNGYRNQNQHRKTTQEKNILPPLLQGFEPTTFQWRVQRSNHWAIIIMTTLYKLFFFFLTRYLLISWNWVLTFHNRKKDLLPYKALKMSDRMLSGNPQ